MHRAACYDLSTMADLRTLLPAIEVTGYLAAIGTLNLLLVSDQPIEPPAGLTLAAPRPQSLRLHVAFPWLTDSARQVFPISLVFDYGDQEAGLEAVMTVARKGQLLPRTELSGTLLNGEPIDCFIRELDLALPPFVWLRQPGDDFPGHLLYGAVQLDATLGAQALAPGGDWHPVLDLALPVYRLNPAALSSAALPDRLASVIGNNQHDTTLQLSEI